MEKELAKMRAGLTESVQYMEQKEMNTNIEYVVPRRRVAASDVESGDRRGLLTRKQI